MKHTPSPTTSLNSPKGFKTWLKHSSDNQQDLSIFIEFPLDSKPSIRTNHNSWLSYATKVFQQQLPISSPISSFKIKKKSSFVGSGMLNKMVSPDGFKAWLKIDKNNPLKKSTVIEFRLNAKKSTRTKQRRWIAGVIETYQKRLWYKDIKEKLLRGKQTKHGWGEFNQRTEKLRKIHNWIRKLYHSLKKKHPKASSNALIDMTILEADQKTASLFGKAKAIKYSPSRLKRILYSQK